MVKNNFISLLYLFLNNVFGGDVPCAWIWWIVWACLFESGHLL